MYFYDVGLAGWLCGNEIDILYTKGQDIFPFAEQLEKVDQQ